MGLKRLLLLPIAAGLAGCATIDRLTSGNVDRREFKLRKVWVRSAVAEKNEGYRKINRMTPIIAGPVILTGNAIDGLVAWERDSGRELWRVRTINGIEGGAAAIRDRVFFGASDGMFYSVDIRSGRILWSVPTKAETLSEPLIDGENGRVYVLTANNAVFAFEAESGKTAWVYSRQDANNFSIRGGTRPALKNGTLYVGFSDGFLAALNVKTGQILWDVQLNRNKRFKDVDTSPVIEGDRLFVAGYDDRLYALSAAKGEILWRHDGGGYAGLTVLGPRVFYPTSEGELRALDKESGKLLWTVPVAKGISTSVVPYKGLIAYGESRGELKFADVSSGRTVASFEPGRGVFSAPAVDEKTGRVYFISNESNVYALEAGWGLRGGFPWLKEEGFR